MKKMRGRSQHRGAIVSGANPISIPETAAARANGPAPRTGTFARAGQQWFGRRRADRRSRSDECVAAMRRRRPIPQSRTKKPAADLSARVNQTRLDDVILPVFCPTCQTNLQAARKLTDQEDRPMTSDSIPQETSRNLAGAGPRSEQKPRGEEARDERGIVEDSGENEDTGRDLAHGEGGAMELPTKPGDLSKDD
ncbi:MAG: hypothetical protein ACOY3N_31495 [Bradyrhizobium sp.]|uniref:hypothetical protein n=1 Tax=Bradyrhizobium sp. TaxID=376 RepID=UPI003BF2F14E